MAKLKVEEVSNPAFSGSLGNGSLGNGYMYHAGEGWKGEHVLQYDVDVILEWCNLKYAVMFSHVCLLGRRQWSTIVDKKVMEDGHVVERWSEPDKSPQAAIDQGSAGLPIKGEEGAIEDSSMGGRQMGSQKDIICEE